jgi:hypothetical protein
MLSAAFTTTTRGQESLEIPSVVEETDDLYQEDHFPSFVEESTPCFRPEQVVETGSHLWYGSSREKGFLVSFDQGETWEARNEGLPRRKLGGAEQIRTITAIGVDTAAPERVALTTADQIYLSGDCGVTWRRIPFSNGSVLTSIALAPGNHEQMLVGTSFAGIYEEIAALAYHPENPDKLVLACGFGNGLYLYNKTLNIWEQLETGETRKLVKNLYFQPAVLPAPDAPEEQAWWLQITYDTETAIYAWPAFELLAVITEPQQSVVDPAKAARMVQATDKYGIYVRSDYASGQRLDNHLRFMKQKGLNSMVVDFKDDLGFITYDTQVPLAHEIKAVQRRLNIQALIRKAKENDIYLIGRVVVFKDSRLYRYNNYQYAVWDRSDDGPWRHLVVEKTADGDRTYVQREHWVDPFAPAVWEYNLAIAAELEALGVDEIQFDYIRFPTDGDLSRCSYRYQPTGAQRVDALEGFLAQARAKLQVPISTDLYGFNCWYQWEGLTGQNIRALAHYVDVICPMYYPSHFPASFYPGDYLERAAFIYEEGSFRANVLTGGESLIRPYVQAFLLTGYELRMTAPVYTEYLLKQVIGTLVSPAVGFTLWNNSNRYYMVGERFVQYLDSPN